DIMGLRPTSQFTNIIPERHVMNYHKYISRERSTKKLERIDPKFFKLKDTLTEYVVNFEDPNLVRVPPSSYKTSSTQLTTSQCLKPRPLKRLPVRVLSNFSYKKFFGEDSRPPTPRHFTLFFATSILHLQAFTIARLFICGKRKLSPYNAFMKSELPKVKAENPNLEHKAAFKLVAERWKSSSENPK
ncbi:1676_t:CDS:2, partial [Acaulospora morrowiae]